MQKNHAIMIFVSAAFVLIGANCSWAGSRFQQRQDKQLKHIHSGVDSGKITRQEYQRLMREQRNIRQYRGSALADGFLTRKERRNLEQLQNRADRHIYLSRRNSDHRPQRNGQRHLEKQRNKQHHHQAAPEYYRYQKQGSQKGYYFAWSWTTPNWSVGFATDGRR